MERMRFRDASNTHSEQQGTGNSFHRGKSLYGKSLYHVKPFHRVAMRKLIACSMARA